MVREERRDQHRREGDREQAGVGRASGLGDFPSAPDGGQERERHASIGVPGMKQQRQGGEGGGEAARRGKVAEFLRVCRIKAEEAGRFLEQSRFNRIGGGFKASRYLARAVFGAKTRRPSGGRAAQDGIGPPDKGRAPVAASGVAPRRASPSAPRRARRESRRQ